MTLNKKRIIQIGSTMLGVLLIATVTIVALREFAPGGVGSSQSENAKGDTTLTGSPGELRQKGLDAAGAGDKEKALKYFEAAKLGFENSSNSVAIDEINMQIDQLKSTPVNTSDNQFVSPENQKNDPGYVTQ